AQHTGSSTPRSSAGSLPSWRWTGGRRRVARSVHSASIGRPGSTTTPRPARSSDEDVPSSRRIKRHVSLHANAACATVPPIRPATALIGEETAVRWERRRIVLEEESMRSTIRARAGRTLAIVALIGATLAPAASSVHAADSPLILKVGTDQTFSGLNPWQAVYVLDYEIFTLNYDLLVGY